MRSSKSPKQGHGRSSKGAHIVAAGTPTISGSLLVALAARHVQSLQPSPPATPVNRVIPPSSLQCSPHPSSPVIAPTPIRRASALATQQTPLSALATTAAVSTAAAIAQRRQQRQQLADRAAATSERGLLRTPPLPYAATPAGGSIGAAAVTRPPFVDVDSFSTTGGGGRTTLVGGAASPPLHKGGSGVYSPVKRAGGRSPAASSAVDILRYYRAGGGGSSSGVLTHTGASESSNSSSCATPIARPPPLSFPLAPPHSNSAAAAVAASMLARLHSRHQSMHSSHASMSQRQSNSQSSSYSNTSGARANGFLAAGAGGDSTGMAPGSAYSNPSSHLHDANNEFEGVIDDIVRRSRAAAERPFQPASISSRAPSSVVYYPRFSSSTSSSELDVDADVEGATVGAPVHGRPSNSNNSNSCGSGAGEGVGGWGRGPGVISPRVIGQDCRSSSSSSSRGTGGVGEGGDDTFRSRGRSSSVYTLAAPTQTLSRVSTSGLHTAVPPPLSSRRASSQEGTRGDSSGGPRASVGPENIAVRAVETLGNTAADASAVIPTADGGGVVVAPPAAAGGNEEGRKTQPTMPAAAAAAAAAPAALFTSSSKRIVPGASHHSAVSTEHQGGQGLGKQILVVVEDAGMACDSALDSGTLGSALDSSALGLAAVPIDSGHGNRDDRGATASLQYSDDDHRQQRESMTLTGPSAPSSHSSHSQDVRSDNGSVHHEMNREGGGLCSSLTAVKYGMGALLRRCVLTAPAFLLPVKLTAEQAEEVAAISIAAKLDHLGAAVR